MELNATNHALLLAVVVSDCHGNFCFASDRAVTATVQTPWLGNCEMVGERQAPALGLYALDYHPHLLHAMKCGCYTLDVYLNGTRLNATPLKMKVTPGPADASACILRAPSSTYIHDVGSRAVEMPLETFDVHGNQIHTSGAVVAARKVSEPKVDEFNIWRTRTVGYVPMPVTRDRQDGTYMITFSQAMVGTCELHVEVNGIPMPSVFVEFMDSAAKDEPLASAKALQSEGGSRDSTPFAARRHQS